jgi:hypothetical protein
VSEAAGYSARELSLPFASSPPNTTFIARNLHRFPLEGTSKRMTSLMVRDIRQFRSAAAANTYHQRFMRPI